MAGVVAVAAVIEDFEATQPCKKMKKDDDLVPTRTITNYFMPLTKTVKKPFSPPRSNNIKDYFQKTPPAQEKVSSVKKYSDLQSTESSSSQEASTKLSGAQKQKRTRKIKQQNKLHEQEALSDVCAVITDSPCDSMVKDGGGLSVLGSDTAALLSQISNEICLGEESVKCKTFTETYEDEKKVKAGTPRNTTDDNLCKESTSFAEGKSRIKKPVVRTNKKAKVSHSESCIIEDREQSLDDASLEVNMDETSVLSCSTVTVSFEEFVQSQVNENEDISTDSKSETCTAKPSHDSKSCLDVSDVELAVPQVSPRTLTVQAEVHPISPELIKSPQLRMASIFTRNKKSHMEDDKMSTFTTPQVAADILPDLKRKSNVVLHEEDLELAVVESSSTPKCTQDERKQFMNAFKQPSSDGSKAKMSKAPGKLRQEKENTPDTVQPEEKTDENNSDQMKPKQSTDKPVSGRVKRKSKTSFKKDQTGSSAQVEIPPKQEDPPTPMELGNESDAVADSNIPSAKVLRRSTRDLTRRQTASVTDKDSLPRRTRSQEKAEIATVSQEVVAQVSTPKSHRTKNNVYRAEMLSVVDKQGSPIRIKFTRVFPSSVRKSGDFEISSPLSAKELNALKKRKQAKKLVQKAKALQQSKQAPAGDQPSVRRSSRSKESVKMNYCEDEDSVVFVDVDPSSNAQKSEELDDSQKKLRSLNEVLGKTMLSNKANSKIVSAGKVAPMFMDRKPQRPAVVISLIDESSREGSENSQDDEQFRAKREFLKSGLPESFKRQIARTAANREAYAHACASFQSVVHVQQRPLDCSMWALSWPESPFLSCLKDSYHLPLSPLVSLEGPTGHLTVPAQRACREKVSGWREDFTEPIREQLLKEISTSNPTFPVQRFFTRFLKKHQDYMQAMGLETECGSKTPLPTGLTTSVGVKRKRVDEVEKSGKQAKKKKSTHKEEEPIVILDSPSLADGRTPEATDPVAPSTGSRRRSQRNKQTEKEPLKKMQCDSPIILDSPPLVISTNEPVREDVLWTEKYQPQHSNDIIGNTASVRKLHSWLKEWKLRADREERRKQQEKKQEEDSNDSWFDGDGNEWMEDTEDMLCNTVLITGPTGVGKTAAVYACAQELGFKVFEVNCSSQRSGRQILSQLKEATQSHQVDIQGINAYKPTYFNSYSSSSGSSAKPGSSPRKVNSPRRVVSSPRKPPQSPRGTQKRGGLAPVSLANFFKMAGKPPSKEAGNQDKKAQATGPKKSAKVTQAESRSLETKPTAEDQGKRTATSLILFEEVDVIFDDDSGFLAAIKTFMTTTKRPVILTTSDPTFSTTFDGYFEEIHFQALSELDVASCLQLLCMVENVRTDTQDLTSLLHWNKCDVRQSLLHLQFWTRSGGGCQVPRPISPSGGPECDGRSETAKVKGVGGTLPLASLPPCHVGCTESLLGLLNIQHEKGGDDLFKSNYSAIESLRSWSLEADMRGVNLLYSNMEVLLPLPIRPLPRPTLGSQTALNPEPQPVSQTSHGRVLQGEQCDDSSPLKVSSTMRRKKQLKKDSKNALQSDSDSDDFLSLPKPSLDLARVEDIRPAQDPIAQKSLENSIGRRRAEMSEAERKRSKPVSHCLSTIAEYLDHMSFLDSSLHHVPSQVEGACRPQTFYWPGATMKSGMTDEVRLESRGRMSGFDAKEIQTTLGSLSFSKCKDQISKTWNEVQELDEQIRKETVEELTLPVALHRQSFSLCHSTVCEPRAMKIGKEVINTVLTSRSFSTQGNRAAVLMDYLPSLRTICRSERLKEQGKVKRRFMHYFDGIHLDLPKSTLQHLASSFP